MAFEMTQEELKMIEARWKSDVDSKLDKLISDLEARRGKYDTFMNMLMEREAARNAMRKAVIEKTLAGLIWMVVVGFVSLVWSGTRHEFTQMIDTWRMK